MNNSTRGVTLLSGFVFDVLGEYKAMHKVCAPAFAMAAGLDPKRPDAWCPIDVYNDICAWIEENIGASSVRRAGTAIGTRIYPSMLAANQDTADPIQIMEALTWAAANLIRDPEGRGWEIRAREANRIVMRRTQTFNCILQEGLLLALIEKTGVVMPSVTQERCTRRGDEFCEYEIRWLRDARAR